MTHIANIDEQNAILLQDLNTSSPVYLQNHCTKEVITPRDHITYPFLYGKYALLTTPVLPGNDIHVVLDSFLKFAEYPLVICGEWEANSYAEALYAKYNKNHAIHLLNRVKDLRTMNMLRSNCYVYIDAFYQPDYNTSLIEAMYMQLPILAFASHYNINLTSNKAMYYKMPTELLAALKSLHPTKAAELGSTMKEVISRKINATQQTNTHKQMTMQPVRHTQIKP
ncbi:MAG TPA: glycosyltransferase [Sediminibacterium sp.]|nr:glycosyltransferase [Sediminibacterium sp.]